eukprot:SAG22_NODE_608_length_8601_cov_24.764291_5_plen_78_part_00
MKNLLDKGDDNFQHLTRQLRDADKKPVLAESHALMLRKGIYPYEYVDSFAKLDERRLPLLEAFYSRLSDATPSEADY